MPTQTPPNPDNRDPSDSNSSWGNNRWSKLRDKAGIGKAFEEKYRSPDGFQDGIKSPRKNASDTFNKLKAAEKQSTGCVTGQDRPGDTLGRGFTTGPTKTPNGSHGLRGKLKKLAKRKSSYLVAAGLASIVGSAIAFFMALPLPIVGTMTGIDNVFDSAQEEAVGTTSQRMLNDWIVKDVVQALKTGECRSTVSPKCVVTSKESGPIGKLYRAWSDQRLEYKLANEHGIIFSANKSRTKFYMTVNGSAADLHDVINGKKTIFELNTKDKSPAEIRRYLKESFRDATIWDKTYTRFKVSRYLSRKVGLPRCVMGGCNKDNNLTDRYFKKKQDIKLAAKAGIINRVVAPVSQQWGFMFSCIISPDDCPSSKSDLEKAQPGDTDRETTAHKKIQTNIARYAAKISGEDYDKMLTRAHEISDHKGGPGKFVMETIGKAIGGETGKKLAGGSVPVVGWIILAASIIHGLAEAGPTIQHIGYAINSQGAMALYQTYDTMSSQIKSGNANLGAAGAYSDALSSNMDPTSTDDFDMTSTPIYNETLNGGESSTPSVASSILGGTAFAATTDGQGGKGHCDGGTYPQKSSGVCAEEVLDQKNETASAISDAISSIPGLAGVAGLISKALNIAMTPFNWLTEHLMNAFIAGCQKIPSCNAGYQQLQSQIQKLVQFIIGNLMHIPWSDAMNGGRIITMIIAGKDVTSNQTNKNLLGAPRVSDQLAADIRQQHLAEVKQEFQQRPIFARLFSTDTPYSLMSRLSVAMPHKVSTMGTTITSELFRSPLAAFGDLFGSLFQTNTAFASPFTKDPFGVDQYAYPTGDIPAHPEEFWNNNCVNGPLAKYDNATQQLDISALLNNDANVGFNESTGESYFKKANPCLLIQSSAQAAGALFDPSMVPPDDDTIGGSSSGGSTGSPTPGDAQDVAKQLLANKNVTYYYIAKKDVELAAQGKPGTCGKPIDARLLKIALDIAQSHKIGITAIESACTDHKAGSKHYAGKAIDLSTIDGVVAYNKIASVWPEIKADSDGIYFLQRQCVSSPVPSGMNWRVGDKCTPAHLHYQVGYP